MKISLGKDGYIHIKNAESGVCFVSRAVYDQMQEKIENLSTENASLKTQVAILQAKNGDNYESGVVAGYLKLINPDKEKLKELLEKLISQ